MSELMDFLIGHDVTGLTEDVLISPRLPKDKPFTIKAMTDEEFYNYQTAATSYGKKGKKIKFDGGLFNRTVVINHTVNPNFKDAESIKKAGCATPEQLLSKVLLPGEVTELAERITKLSGFDQDMEDLVNDAKN